MRASEHDEQASFVAWASLVRCGSGRLADYLVMIPNESLLSFLPAGPRRHAYWRRLKSLGFRAGASDLLLAFPVTGFAGLWIEMKRQQASFRGPAEVAKAVSPAQQSFLVLMRSVGFRAEVAWGWNEARTLTESYLMARKSG